MHQFLRSRAERLPQVGNLALVSADGIRVNYSLRWPALAVDMSDRDYARHFSIEDDPGLFISQPVINRESSDICMVALSVAAGQRPTRRVPWHGPGVDAAQCHRRPLSVDHPAERPVDRAVAARWHHAVAQSQSWGSGRNEDAGHFRLVLPGGAGRRSLRIAWVFRHDHTDGLPYNRCPIIRWSSMWACPRMRRSLTGDGRRG
jgi:hypothetical protein